MTALVLWGMDIVPDAVPRLAACVRRSAGHDAVHLASVGLRTALVGEGLAGAIEELDARSLLAERALFDDISTMAHALRSQATVAGVNIIDACLVELLFRARLFAALLRGADQISRRGRISRVVIVSNAWESAFLAAAAGVALELGVPARLEGGVRRLRGARLALKNFGWDVWEALRLAPAALRDAARLPPVPPRQTGSILFLSNTISGARSTCPIVERLWERVGRDRVLVTATRTRVQEWLAHRGVRAYAPQLASHHPRLSGGQLRSILRAACSLSGLWASAARPLIMPSLAASLRTGVEWALRLAGLVRTIQPTAVVVGSGAATPARVLEQLVRDQCTSICVQHGLLNDTPFLAAFRSDVTLTWGEGFSELLQRHRPNGVVVPVGSPQHDTLDLGLSDTDERGRSIRRVLFAMSRIGGALTSEGESTSALAAVLRVAQRRDEVAWTVKLHPADRNRELGRLRTQAPANVRIITDGDMAVLIRHSDAVIVTTSTSGAEAVLLDRPVIAFDVGPASSSLGYVREGAACRVSGEAELQAALDRLESDNDFATSLAHRRAAFRRRWFGELDGCSADRAARVIEEHARR